MGAPVSYGTVQVRRLGLGCVQGGGIDDDVFPSRAHSRILPLAVIIAGAAEGEPAFGLVEPGGVGRY
jgi:hypothetical protein